MKRELAVQKTNITINDIARLAQTSKRTVSRVLNGSPLVGKATLERVQSVIKEYNYQPDKQARGLASKRSYLIGIIYDNPDALYIDQVQRGVLKVCTAIGYELIIHPCQWNKENFIQDCEMFIQRSGVEGVIILPPVSESNKLARVLADREFPYVRIASSELDQKEKIVVSKDRLAMSEIADHLVELGHKNIMMITGPLKFTSSQERLEGFVNALEKKKITLLDEHIVEGLNTYQSGIEWAKSILSMENRPTAIFANNDEMAAGVIKVASDMKISIPDELSVAGFDDNLFASRIIPSLTTIKRPVEEMAICAANKLMSSINPNFSKPESTTQVKPYLIKRESTGKCVEK